MTASIKKSKKKIIKNTSKTSKTSKISKISKTSKTRKTINKYNNDNNDKINIKLLKLVSFADISTDDIKQLSKIYNAYGDKIEKTEEEIKQFVLDEKNQNTKLDVDRTYYSYCIFYNNILIGYIIGKKTFLLKQKYLAHSKPNKYNLLFSIALNKDFKNKGIGTFAINLFINTYAKKIIKQGYCAKIARLYADIASSNIASIKAFEKNKFQYSHNIIISGKQYRRYFRLAFQ